MLSPPDADLVRRDLAIKGLAILLDPDAFVALLQPFLPEIPLEAARVVYVRYKPGTNCLVLYHLQIAGDVVEVYAKAYERDATDKRQKARERRAVATPFGPGRIILEDRAVVASFFPNDARMKSLVRLAGEETRSRFISEVIPECPDLWRGTVRTLRYKPERRYVALLEAEGGARALLKFYTEPGYRAAQRNAQAFRSRGTLRLADKLGSSERRRALVFEWLDGDLLSEVYSHPQFKGETVRLVGASLAELHAQQPGGLNGLTRQAEARTLHELAAGLGFLCPALSDRAQSVADRLINRLMHQPALECAIHGDFYAKQVLLCGDQVAVLDLDEAVYGDPAADLGNFIAHLERDHMRGRLGAPSVESISTALLEGYRKSGCCRDAGQQTLASRVGLYTAVGLFRLAPFPFRDHEADWPEAIEGILERVEVLLSAIANSAQANRASRPPARTPERQSPDVQVADPFGVAADPRMPFLAQALDPTEVQRRFEFSLQSFPRGAKLRAIRVTRYRPHRRAVIEYDLEAGEASNVEAFTLLGKARAKGLDESGFHLQMSLWRGSFNDASADGISVPEPVGMIPEFRMWLQRRVPGRTATGPLTESGGVALARRIAGAIHKLHRTNVTTTRRHAMADELNVLRRRLAAVAEMKPTWSSRLEKVLAACERVAAATPPARRRTIHRDFYADQVIVSGLRLYLIDLDLCCVGDPALDVGNFLGHITEQSLRSTGDPATLGDREEALEERFVELSGTHVRPAVRAYATLTLVRHIYLSTQFADRARWTEALLELCENRLDIARYVCSRGGLSNAVTSDKKGKSYA